MPKTMKILLTIAIGVLLANVITRILLSKRPAPAETPILSPLTAPTIHMTPEIRMTPPTRPPAMTPPSVPPPIQ